MKPRGESLSYSCNVMAFYPVAVLSCRGLDNTCATSSTLEIIMFLQRSALSHNFKTSFTKGSPFVATVSAYRAGGDPAIRFDLRLSA